MSNKIVETWSKSERRKRSKKCANPKGFTMRQFCKNVKTRSSKGEKKNESTIHENILKRLLEISDVPLPVSQLDALVQALQGRKSLLITTSNRWEGEKELPKSSLLAQQVAKLTGATLIDAAALHIATCEGNVSSIRGNVCGVQDSMLKDKAKNPSGNHRCWASINDKDDELWKISKPLLEAEAVVFFASVRWGQTNSVYQRLIERLNWLENRWSTLEEDNIIKNIQAGIVLVGHNWNGGQVLDTQKQVLQFFGFNVPSELSFNWQWTNDTLDETAEGYEQEPQDFGTDFNLLPIERLLKKKP
jgi:multimeric flavodoxin WrbA